MSRRSEDVRNWEKVLAENSFDLPDATWTRMENDMRGFLAAQARQVNASTELGGKAAWQRRLLDWFQLPVVRWGGVLAGLVLLAGAFLGRGAIVGTGSMASWVPGRILETSGVEEWTWSQGRCSILGRNSRMVLRQASAGEIGIDLERGEATFKVEHRRPDETFSVKVGECRVRVVGTTFTVGIDSLEQWVAVEEGKIRFENARGHRYVSAGQSSVCREVGRGDAVATSRDSAAVPVASTSEPSGSKALETGSRKSVAASAAVPEIAVPACQAGEGCIQELSDFVRSHPGHAAVPEIALRWARLAAAKGDNRDALVAYGIVVGKGGASAATAKLESFRLRIRSMAREDGLSDSLRSWIAGLPEGGALWKDAMGLKRDLARRAGDQAEVERIEKLLRGTSTAENGIR